MGKASVGGSNGIARTTIGGTFVARYTSVARSSQALVTTPHDGVEGLFPNPLRICQLAEFACAGFARRGYGEGCWAVGPGRRGERGLFFPRQLFSGMLMI